MRAGGEIGKIVSLREIFLAIRQGLLRLIGHQDIHTYHLGLGDNYL